MNSSTTRLWQMLPSLLSMTRIAELADARPPAFAWLNRDAFSAAAAGRGEAHDEYGLPLGQVTGCDLSGAPTPRLCCTDPDFVPDLIFQGEMFVSRRLRDTMALDDHSVQWLAVDCLDCPPVMRAADYRLMNLLAFANPMDRARSAPAMFDDVVLPDGSATFVWSAPPYQPGGPVPRIVWRTGFAAPAPLFRVPGLSWVLATDTLAERMMSAGAFDLVFADIENGGMRVGGGAIVTRQP